MRLSAVLLALPLVLAGCIDDSPSTEPVETATEDDSGPAPSQETPGTRPTPTTPTSPTSAPPSSPPAAQNHSAPPSSTTSVPPPPPQPRVVELNATYSATAVATAPCAPDPEAPTDVRTCPVEHEGSSAVFTPPAERPAKATLTATWENSQSPADDRIEVRLVDAEGNLLVSGLGAPGFTLEVPVANLTGTDLRAYARPETGAAAELEVALSLRLEYP